MIIFMNVRFTSKELLEIKLECFVLILVVLLLLKAMKIMVKKLFTANGHAFAEKKSDNTNFCYISN